MTIHIALLGKSIEPVLKGYHHYGSVQKLYILHSPDTDEFEFRQIAIDLRDKFTAVGFTNVMLLEINAFDLHNIIDSILNIVDKEKGPFYINITGGTNLMAGAACTAAFFIGARAYYILKSNSFMSEQVVELPFPHIPYYKSVDANQMLILRELEHTDNWTLNSQLRDSLHLSAQLLSYHVKKLENIGLIETEREHYAGVRGRKKESIDSRQLKMRVTNAGRLVLSWRTGE